MIFCLETETDSNKIYDFILKGKTDSSDYNQMQPRTTIYVDWLQNYEPVYALDTSNAKTDTPFLKSGYKLKKIVNNTMRQNKVVK